MLLAMVLLCASPLQSMASSTGGDAGLAVTPTGAEDTNDNSLNSPEEEGTNQGGNGGAEPTPTEEENAEEPTPTEEENAEEPTPAEEVTVEPTPSVSATPEPTPENSTTPVPTPTESENPETENQTVIPVVLVTLDMELDKVLELLPDQLEGISADGTTAVYDVTWSSEDYTPYRMGVYTFTAMQKDETGESAEPSTENNEANEASGNGAESNVTETPAAVTLQDAKRLVVAATTCTCPATEGQEAGHVHDRDNTSCALWTRNTVTITMPDGTSFIIAQEDADAYTAAGGVVSSQAMPQLLTGARGTNVNDANMNRYMNTFTEQNTVDVNYATESSEGNLPWTWRNYINTIWQYKAMGSFTDAAGTTHTSSDGFKWTDTEALSLPKWSGIMPTDAHEWLNGSADWKITPSDGSTSTTGKLGIGDTIQRMPDGSGETIVDEASMKNYVENMDPAKTNPNMVPFNILTHGTGTVSKRTLNERTFYVWSGEQLLYALKYASASNATTNEELVAAGYSPDQGADESKTNRPKGAAEAGAYWYTKINVVLMRDIDLNGAENNWPVVSMYPGRWPRLEIQGNNHTIYNFGLYRNNSNTQSSTSRAAGLVIGNAGINAYDLTFESAKMVVTKESNTPCVGIFGRSEAGNGNPGNGYASGGNYVDYGESDLNNVKVSNSMFFSGVVASNVSAFGEFSRNATGDAQTPAVIQKCSVESCYIYGGDHAAGFTTANSGKKSIAYGGSEPKTGYESKISNSYVANTLIATYGGHSGGFASCSMRQATIENCFSDVDMYAAVYSGGFLGLASGTVTNCFSTGKLEGYRFCGGFLAAVANLKATGVNQGLDITNCYSTVLTGLRQESSYMGGFYAAGRATDGGYVSQVAMTSCYAAGEVGDTNVDTAKDASFDSADANGNIGGNRRNGGFASYMDVNNEASGITYGYGTSGNNAGKTGDAAGNNGPSIKTALDTATDCYYDKQTTAMKEWSTGSYNLRGGGHENSVTAGVSGVMTKDYSSGTSKVGGLVGTNPGDADEGFRGFTTEGWFYSDTNYPQLKIFQNATEDAGWSARQIDMVKRYSDISTATVYLDAWSEGYAWDENGIRTSTTVDYTGVDPDNQSVGTHVGNKYSYDTVRDMIKNTEYTPTNTIVAKRLVNPSASSGGTVEVTSKVKNSSSVDRSNAYTISGDFINIQAPGMGWFGLSSEVDTDKYRPLRLVSTMNIEAGADSFVYAGDTYDHRETVRLSTAIKIIPNKVIGLNDNDIWSEVDTGGFSAEDSIEGNFTEKYFQAESKNIDSYASDASAIKGAWVNTEIWRAMQTFPENMPLAEHVPDGGATYATINSNNGTAYPEPAYTAPYNSSEYYWWVDKDEDGNVGVYLRRREGTNISENDRYVDAYRVKLDGTEENIDKEKWIGKRALYPDTASPKKYSISYYWVLSDGRYASDYKTVSIKPGYYNLYMNTYSYHEGSITDPYNPYGIKLEPKADVAEKSTSAAPTGYEWKKQIDFTDNTTDAAAFYGPDGENSTETAENDIKNLDNSLSAFDGFTTDTDHSIRYTNDGTTAWQLLNDDIVIKKIQITMYARNGDVMGTGYAGVQKDGTSETGTAFSMQDLKDGNVTITVPTEYYGVSTTTDVNHATVESTVQGSANVGYTVQYDAPGNYFYISLCKYFKDNQSIGGNTGSMEPEQSPQEQTLQTGSGDNIDITSMMPYINDTQYHVRVDLWVDTYDLTVEKEITGNYGEDDAKFYFNVQLTDLKMPMSLADFTQYYMGKEGDVNQTGTHSTMEAVRGIDEDGNPIDIIAGYQMPANITQGLDPPQNGVALGDKETVTIRDLPVGIQYEITEFGGSSQYYTDYMTSVRVGDAEANSSGTVIGGTNYSNRLKALDGSDAAIKAKPVSELERDALDENGAPLGRLAAFIQDTTQPGALAGGYAGGTIYGMVASGSNFVRYRNLRDYTVPTMADETETKSYLWAFLLGLAVIAFGGTTAYIQVKRKRRRKQSSSHGL